MKCARMNSTCAECGAGFQKRADRVTSPDYCEESPPRREQTAQDLDYCPACGGECNDEQPCDYCNNTGYVTETAYNEYRPLSPDECL